METQINLPLLLSLVSPGSNVTEKKTSHIVLINRFFIIAEDSHHRTVESDSEIETIDEPGTKSGKFILISVPQFFLNIGARPIFLNRK